MLNSLRCLTLLVLVASVLMGALASGAAARPGEIDTMFGANGILMYPKGERGDVLPTTDQRGRLISVHMLGGRHDNGVLVRRWTQAGTVDRTFGVGGVVRLPWFMADEVTTRQNQAYLLVTRMLADDTTWTGILRLRSDGSFDPAFGVGGVRWLDQYAGPFALGRDGITVATSHEVDHGHSPPAHDIVHLDFAGDVISEPAGQPVSPLVGQRPHIIDVLFYAAGFTSDAGTDRGSVSRLTAGGQLDTAWSGGDGSFAFTRPDSYAAGVIDAGGGGVYVSGEWWRAQGVSTALLYRLTANGLPDTSFSGDGLVPFMVGSKATDARSMFSNSDGSIFVSGSATPLGSQLAQPYLAKFRRNGSIDPSFARDGSTKFDDLPTGGDITLIGSTPDKVLLAGITSGATGNESPEVIVIRLCRTNACSGVLADARTFGTGGADDIIGSWSEDEISAGRGADDVAGAAGDDELSGGLGNDELIGGTGNDGLTGGAGADELAGGPGADIVSGGEGADVLGAGAGNDLVIGTDGVRDVITCGSGIDRVVADVVDRVLAGCETVRRVG